MKYTRSVTGVVKPFFCVAHNVCQFLIAVLNKKKCLSFIGHVNSVNRKHANGTTHFALNVRWNVDITDWTIDIELSKHNFAFCLESKFAGSYERIKCYWNNVSLLIIFALFVCLCFLCIKKNNYKLFSDVFAQQDCKIDCYTLPDCKAANNHTCTSFPVECAMGTLLCIVVRIFKYNPRLIGIGLG